MRVLITGAAGIIGTVLTKGLKDRYELHGLDRDPMPLMDHTTIGDISDFETVKKASTGQLCGVGGLMSLRQPREQWNDARPR